MDTQKISVMKLIEAELENRVQHTEPELTKIDMIVRLAEVRTTIEGMQEAKRKANVGIILPPEAKAM
jgi:hypothetical protein